MNPKTAALFFIVVLLVGSTHKKNYFWGSILSQQNSETL